MNSRFLTVIFITIFSLNICHMATKIENIQKRLTIIFFDKFCVFFLYRIWRAKKRKKLSLTLSRAPQKTLDWMLCDRCEMLVITNWWEFNFLELNTILCHLFSKKMRKIIFMIVKIFLSYSKFCSRRLPEKVSLSTKTFSHFSRHSASLMYSTTLTVW